MQAEAAQQAEAALQAKKAALQAKKEANQQAEKNAIKKICFSGLCLFDNLPSDISDPLWDELQVVGELTSAELVALKVVKTTFQWWNRYSANKQVPA